MLKVRKDLCLGCGFCVESCPRQAIRIVWEQAEIEQNKCVPCRICREVCPQGAIVDIVLVTRGELQTTVADLKQRTDDLIERIERLRF